MQWRLKRRPDPRTTLKIKAQRTKGPRKISAHSKINTANQMQSEQTNSKRRIRADRSGALYSVEVTDNGHGEVSLIMFEVSLL